MTSELTLQRLREVVERARLHDPDAWEQLYRHSHPRLTNYARRRLPTQQAAEDAVSDAFVRAMDRIDGFAWQGAGFDAWMYGILRNVVLEAHRRHGRAMSVQPDILAEQAGHDASDVAAPLLRSEEHAALHRAFAELDPSEQELLELRVIGGLGADEVGTVVDKSAGAVRMAQSRALGRLRSMMRIRDDV